MDTEVTKVLASTVAKGSEKGISKLVDILFSKKVLNQKRLETLSTTQDKKDAELIEKGLAEFRDGKFLLIDDQIGNPTSALGLILEKNNNKQSENVAKCLNQAYLNLASKTDEEISSEDVSDTFINKWINYGREISEEELQSLWGHILSEEISKPNTINYMVLNTLSQMTKKNLECFLELMIGNSYGRLVFYDQKRPIWEQFENLDYYDFNELHDLNIIKATTSSIHTVYELSRANVRGENLSYFTKGKEGDYVLYLHGTHNKILKPAAYELTTIGLKLLEIAERNIDLDDLCRKFSQRIFKFDIFSGVTEIEIKLRNIDQSYTDIALIKRT